MQAPPELATVIRRTRDGPANPGDLRCSSFNECAGSGPEEQRQRCTLAIGHVRIPADSRIRL